MTCSYPRRIAFKYAVPCIAMLALFAVSGCSSAEESPAFIDASSPALRDGLLGVDHRAHAVADTSGTQ